MWFPRHIHIDKVVLECTLSLDPAVPDLAYFVTIEGWPLLRVELHIKLDDVNAVHKVDESIPHVAFVFKVDRQVEEVICIFVILVDQVEQHHL